MMCFEPSQDTQFPPGSPRDFVHSVLCQRGDDHVMFHRMACVQGSCNVCGLLASLHLHETDSLDQEIVKWRQYQYV